MSCSEKHGKETRQSNLIQFGFGLDFAFAFDLKDLPAI